jgi:hypothetical protein
MLSDHFHSFVQRRLTFLPGRLKKRLLAERYALSAFEEHLKLFNEALFSNAVSRYFKISVFLDSDPVFWLRRAGSMSKTTLPDSELSLAGVLADAIKETEPGEPTEIDVRRIHGITGSRSGGTSLAEIAFSWRKGHEGYYCDSHEVAQRRVQGILKEHSETHLIIVHRRWDDRYFWQNGDGSHRMSGIFRFALEHNTSVMLPARVKTVDLNLARLSPYLQKWDLFLTPKTTLIKLQQSFGNGRFSFETIPFIFRNDTLISPRASEREREKAIDVDVVSISTESILGREVSAVIRKSPSSLDVSAYLHQTTLASRASKSSFDG